MALFVFWEEKTEKGDERKICIKNKCCGCCKQSSFCCNVHASYPFNHSYKLAKSSSIGHIMHRTVHTNMDKLYAHTWSVQCTLSLVMVFICIKPNQGHVLLINAEYIQAIIFVWSYLHKHSVSSYCLLAGAKQLWSQIFYTSIFVEEFIFSFGNRLFFARYFLQQNFYKLCLWKKWLLLIQMFGFFTNERLLHIIYGVLAWKITFISARLNSPFTCFDLKKTKRLILLRFSRK